MTDYEKLSLSLLSAIGTSLNNLTSTVGILAAKASATPELRDGFNRQLVEQMDINNGNMTQWNALNETVMSHITGTTPPAKHGDYGGPETSRK